MLNKAKEKHFDLFLNVLFGLRAVRVLVSVYVRVNVWVCLSLQRV